MTSRSLKIALAASVALNLFAVGAGGAAWVARDRVAAEVAEERQRPRSARFDEMLGRVSEANRDRVRASLTAGALAARPDFDEARRTRREAVDRAAAPDFDAVAISGLLERSRAAELRGRQRLEAHAVTILADLPPTDRAALADILKRSGGRSGDRDRGARSERR